VEAVREKEKGVLKIDGVPEFQGSAPERATQLQVSILFIYLFIFSCFSFIHLLSFIDSFRYITIGYGNRQ
jgi:hypothetical protein